MSQPPRPKGIEELGQRMQTLREPNTLPATPQAGQPERPAASASIPAATVAIPAPASRPSAFQRIVSGLRAAAPHVIPLAQRLLPLVEGNVAGAVANVLTSRPQQSASLEPIVRELHEQQTALAEHHQAMRSQLGEQSATLRRVEDQLDQVRSATDRNTLEQRELVEDLHSTSRKLNLVAILGLILLIISISLNVFLFYRLQPLLR